MANGIGHLKLAFYVSGHGFGHASRQVEIINTVARRAPDAAFLIRSTTAPWLLERTLTVPFSLDPQPVDTGVAQMDGLHLDPVATVEHAKRFYADFDARADAEASS